jgi:CubicO group peptidase (beta-lactamase class C family)
VISLTDRVETVAVESRFSGAVRVDREGRTELAVAYGLAHRGEGIPITVNTRFGIASATKGLTALTVMSQ